MRIVKILFMLMLASVICISFTACVVKGEARQFRILTYGDYASMYDSEEIMGNVLNDTVYLRNRKAENECNIVIEVIDTGVKGYKEQSELMKSHIYAGDNAFEITLEHAVNGPQTSLDGIFVNLYDIPEINLKKPWWFPNVTEELTFMGQLYMGAGAINYYGLGTTKAICFNVSKLKDYGIESPYNDVIDGNWTLDKLILATKDIYEDVNGNGERNFDDFYGYATYSVQNAWLTACEIPVFKKTDDSLTITVFSEKTISLIDKLYRWYFNTNGAIALTTSKDETTGYSRTEWQDKIFGEGHALFACSDLNTASEIFKQGVIDYGILPIPKYSESQEKYKSFSSELFFAVPMTCTDLKFVGKTLETLCCMGYEDVIPVFINETLRNKSTSAVKVLNLIRDSRAISFSYVFDNREGFGHLLSDMFGEPPSIDFASYYRTQIDSAEARISKIIDFYASAS